MMQLMMLTLLLNMLSVVGSTINDRHGKKDWDALLGEKYSVDPKYHVRKEKEDKHKKRQQRKAELCKYRKKKEMIAKK
jgi:hypothetical protein